MVKYVFLIWLIGIFNRVGEGIENKKAFPAREGLNHRMNCKNTWAALDRCWLAP